MDHTTYTEAGEVNGQVCEWKQMGDDYDSYETTCGNAFTLNAGTPADNAFLFCCYCGKPLSQVMYKGDEEDHE